MSSSATFTPNLDVESKVQMESDGRVRLTWLDSFELISVRLTAQQAQELLWALRELGHEHYWILDDPR